VRLVIALATFATLSARNTYALDASECMKNAEVLVWEIGCDGRHISIIPEITACSGETLYPGTAQGQNGSTILTESKYRALRVRLGSDSAISDGTKYWVEIAPMNTEKSVGWLKRDVGIMARDPCTF
jgi:hypothetical protein